MSLMPKKLHGRSLKCSGAPMCSDCQYRVENNIPFDTDLSEDAFWSKVMNNLAPDPVRKYEDGWYFWEETWADKQGPFATEEEARRALDKYVKDFLG